MSEIQELKQQFPILNNKIQSNTKLYYNKYRYSIFLDFADRSLMRWCRRWQSRKLVPEFNNVCTFIQEYDNPFLTMLTPTDEVNKKSLQALVPLFKLLAPQVDIKPPSELRIQNLWTTPALHFKNKDLFQKVLQCFVDTKKCSLILRIVMTPEQVGPNEIAIFRKSKNSVQVTSRVTLITKNNLAEIINVFINCEEHIPYQLKNFFKFDHVPQLYSSRIVFNLKNESTVTLLSIAKPGFIAKVNRFKLIENPEPADSKRKKAERKLDRMV